MTIQWPADEPLWVEVRSMLENGGECFGTGADYVVRDPPPCHALAIVGYPDPHRLTEALAGLGGPLEVLAQEDNLAWLASLLPSWRCEAVIVHTREDEPIPPPDIPVRRLSAEDPLDHLPVSLREEMERARARTAVFSTFDGERAVSFAYAHRMTSRCADISIDTLAAFRRRGHAMAACAPAPESLAQGRRPIWGAYESNAASKRLAARLGFMPVGTIYGFTTGA